MLHNQKIYTETHYHVVLLKIQYKIFCRHAVHAQLQRKHGQFTYTYKHQYIYIYNVVENTSKD